MDLIPALDIKNNTIVSSYKGNRHSYKSICSKYFVPENVINFINYIRNLSNIHTIYIADIDAIMNLKQYKNNIKIIKKILYRFKNIDFIIDHGIRSLREINMYKNYTNYLPVIGTETFLEYRKLQKNKSLKYILSVDKHNNKILFKNNYVSQYKYINPSKIICMNIDNVGTNRGPDIEFYKKIKKVYKNKDIIISGGIDINRDLDEIKNHGCSKVIVLSSLLNKSI
tara:strand:+ start:2198 stop:2875 length:678 start_codon:yes stop_codon:yes gene_type:complete